MNKLSSDPVMKMFAAPGITLTAISTSGVRVKTQEYGELVDLQSGDWAAVLGHGRKEIVEIINNNLGQLLHTHQFFDTEHPGALVNELITASELKSSYKGTFLSSGSEAVSLAVAFADLISKRQKKLSFSISYLGASSGLRLPRNPDTWLDLDIKECLSCTKNISCSECKKFSDINFSEISAFVFEPGNSGGLVLCPPEKLISYLVSETKKAGGFIVVNEVTTGFGRTGKWFGFQHYGTFNTGDNSPDFIAIGKGLGNGYPISGVLAKTPLAEAIENSGYRYVQSHSNDPLGCMVARKVVEIIRKEGLVEKGNEVGAYLRSNLARINGITEIRGRGMMNIAILDNHHKAKEVFISLIKRGFFVGYSEFYNSLQFYGSLITTKQDTDMLCEVLEDILQK